MQKNQIGQVINGYREKDSMIAVFWIRSSQAKMWSEVR